MIDFHRFPLSIDKNHLIAINFIDTDFYQLTTPGLLDGVRAKRKVMVPGFRSWKLGIRIATCHSAMLYFVKKALEKIDAKDVEIFRNDLG